MSRLKINFISLESLLTLKEVNPNIHYDKWVGPTVPNPKPNYCSGVTLFTQPADLSLSYSLLIIVKPFVPCQGMIPFPFFIGGDWASVIFKFSSFCSFFFCWETQGQKNYKKIIWDLSLWFHFRTQVLPFSPPAFFF